MKNMSNAKNSERPPPEGCLTEGGDFEMGHRRNTSNTPKNVMGSPRNTSNTPQIEMGHPRNTSNTPLD